MSSRRAPLALALGLLVASRTAVADSSDASAQADAFFRSAKVLRAAGKYPEACAAFAESKRLAAGIGVSLYLADCYEHIGKLASAASEFHDAERRARERNDKRADVAYAREVALEARLGHIGVANPLGRADGVDASLDDGDPLRLGLWTTFGVDPGDHSVTFRVAGRVVRRASAHVDAGRWAILRFDPPQAPGAPPIGAVSAEPGERLDPRRVAGYSLIATGFVGVAAGAGLLALKNQSLSTGAPDGSPTVNQGAAIGSDIAFAVGGAAFASAILLYLTTPKETAVVVAPVPLVGGAGGVLTARF